MDRFTKAIKKLDKKQLASVKTVCIEKKAKKNVK